MSELLDMLLNGVGVVGNVLDTPGAIVRNSLSGRNPFSGLNPFDSEGRASGRDMLESWGALDPNEEGLDWGDVAGFGAELATDPLNFLGLGAARNTARAAREARAANATSDAMRAAGAMPEEIAKLTKIVDEAGNPKRMYHGTSSVFDRYDPAMFDEDGLFGKGVYTTSSGDVASSYAGIDSRVPDSDLGWVSQQLENQGRSPNVRMHYVDIRNPFRPDDVVGADVVKSAQRHLGDLPPVPFNGSDWLEEAKSQHLADFLGQEPDEMLGDELFDVLKMHSVDPSASLRGMGFDGVVHEGGRGLAGLESTTWRSHSVRTRSTGRGSLPDTATSPRTCLSSPCSSATTPSPAGVSSDAR